MKSSLMLFSVALFVWINVAVLVNAGNPDPDKDYRHNIDVTKNYTVFPFFKEIRDGNVANVQTLLSSVAKDDLNNGLVIAARAGRDEVAKLLLERGASTQFKRNGLSPLTASILWASVCHRAGIEICDVSDISKMTKTLIEYKADVNEILDEARKHTTLHFVTTLGFIDTTIILELLLNAGADVNYLDVDKRTALHWSALSYDQPEMIELLLIQGANIDALTTDVWGTALHISAFMGFERSAEILLRYGADRNLLTTGGQTPIDSANDNPALDPVNRQNIIDLLKTYPKRRRWNRLFM